MDAFQALLHMLIDVCHRTLLGELHIQATFQKVPVEYVSALDFLELYLFLGGLGWLLLL